jgi:hypothetical protein
VFTAQRTALEEIRLTDSVMKKHVVSANRTWWSKWRLFYQTPMLGTKQTPGGLVANDCFRLENAKIAPDLVEQQLTNSAIIKFREMIVQRPCCQQCPNSPHEGVLGFQQSSL